MNTSITVFLLSLIVFSVSYADPQTEESETKARTLFDFTSDQSASQWSSVNDGVMGGVSDGKHMVRDGKLEFIGNLSLANNGGFASIRSRPSPLALRDSDVLVIRVRGDGRQYFMDLRPPTNRTAFSYRSSFATKAGQWQEARLPVKAFQATSFGRELANSKPIDAKAFQSLGFMLADKKAGPFKLEVDWIKVAPE